MTTSKKKSPTARSLGLPAGTELVYVDDVHDNLTNYNEHPKEQIDEIADSITRYGVADLIKIDEDGIILGGHATKLAFIQLGWEWLPCFRVLNLSDDDKEGLQIALNTLPRWATPDTDRLKASVERIMAARNARGDEPDKIIGLSLTRLNSILSSDEWQNPATQDRPPRAGTADKQPRARTEGALIRITCPHDEYDKVLSALEVALEDMPNIIIT